MQYEPDIDQTPKNNVVVQFETQAQLCADSIAVWSRARALTYRLHLNTMHTVI